MHVTLHVTRDCNMACSYCYAPPQSCAGMTFETARKAVDLGASTSGGRCGVVFFGGEPLLRKELIIQVIDYCRSIEKQTGVQFHFKLTTNGLLMDEAFLDFSLRNGLFIGLSFDGIKAAHDTFRRLPDGTPTHAFLIKRLELLLRVKPYSSVMLTVNPETARYLSDSIYQLKSLGCRYMIVSLNHDADWDAARFSILKKEYEILGNAYIRWTRNEDKFFFSPFETKISSHVNRHCYQNDRCELGQKQISISPEGGIFPCVQFPYAGEQSQWCIGHVDTGIDMEKQKAIFQLSQEEKKGCEGCMISDRCNHTCGCLNWQTMGDINKVSPVLCHHEQMLMRIADRVGKVLYKERNPTFLHKQYNSLYPVMSLIEDVLD
ncbi:radical SAM protein [bacterium]|nr:radical SAM protein [bacterium]